jgi:hypothetical protein
MKRTDVKYVLSILILCCAFSSNALGATIQAVNCSSSSVQSAINSSNSGDTVSVPSGTCTWTAGVVINGKRIVLQGAGIDQTIVNTNLTGSAIQLTGNQSSAITGFTFNLSQSGLGILINGGRNWRIHHNKFLSTRTNLGVDIDAINGEGVTYIPYGVVDHNKFVGAYVLTFGRGHLDWAADTNWGSVEATYIEDNEYTLDNQHNSILVSDANYGGRVVFRYNRITVASDVTGSYDGNFQWHSLQGDGTTRGSRKFEIYNNIWISNRTGGSAVALWPRAGTGVAFNNSFINYGETAMLLDNVRSYSARDSYGLCDGSAAGNVDGNQPGSQGYPCRDQVGRGRDAFLFVFGSTPYPSQASEPVYQWNNYRYATLSAYNSGPSAGVVTDFAVSDEGLSKIHIVANRDFYNRVQKPGYTPYIYPHPLTIGGNPPPSPTSQPDPPTNLRIISSSSRD